MSTRIKQSVGAPKSGGGGQRTKFSPLVSVGAHLLDGLGLDPRSDGAHNDKIDAAVVGLDDGPCRV